MKIKDTIKNEFRRWLPYSIYEKVLNTYSIVRKPYAFFKDRERKVNWGSDHPDKIFYIIRCFGRGALFQYYYFVVSQLLYAKQKGYIPIVDMTDMRIPYRKGNDDKSNVWEHYFSQPEGISLEQIKNCRNVVLSSYKVPITISSDLLYTNTEEGKQLFREIQSLTTLNEEMRAHMDEQYELLIGNKNVKSVLGVHMRGTDYVKLKPKGHAIQPDLDMTVQKSIELVNFLEIDLVYACTEDAVLLRGFQAALEGIVEVVYTDSARLNEYQCQSTDIVEQLKENGKENTGFFNGLEYLTDIYLLSKCDYLFAGSTAGTRAAILLNGGNYKEKYIANLGVY